MRGSEMKRKEGKGDLREMEEERRKNERGFFILGLEKDHAKEKNKK